MNDKVKKATAIRYDINEEAPTVIAKGKGYIADKIIEKGIEEEIRFYEDEDLVESLSNIEIGSYIPPELYEVVSEVLIFIDEIDKRYSTQFKRNK
ncbi:MAG: EscU/YscU/HrcU family type III secretion system export apparatus switch protein [Eubacteriales bacterium]